jgi:hypothetical protein
MSLLALAWYTYVWIAAGGIVTVGGAIALLVKWGRALVSFLRQWMSTRRVRVRREKQTRPEPSEEQRRVLNAVLRYFLGEGNRAPFRLLDKRLDREGVQLRANAESLPPGLLTPDIQPRGGFFYPDDELMVTLEGLRYCDDGDHLLDLLARVLGDLAAREKAYMPTVDVPDLTVRSDEVRRAVGLTELETAQARHLLAMFEPRVLVSATWGQGSQWSVTLDLERVRRFRGVETGTEYLLARTGERSYAGRLGAAWIGEPQHSSR